MYISSLTKRKLREAEVREKMNKREKEPPCMSSGALLCEHRCSEEEENRTFWSIVFSQDRVPGSFTRTLTSHLSRTLPRVFILRPVQAEQAGGSVVSWD